MSYKPNDPRAKLGSQLLRDLGERETEERRIAPRFLAPVLDVLINKRIYKTVDWGLGALVLGDCDLPKADAALSLTLSRAEDPETAFKASATVIRVDKRRKRVTLQFVEVGKGMLGWLGDLQLTGGHPRS
jgi:hypothetical protein